MPFTERLIQLLCEYALAPWFRSIHILGKSPMTFHIWRVVKVDCRPGLRRSAQKTCVKLPPEPLLRLSALWRYRSRCRAAVPGLSLQPLLVSLIRTVVPKLSIVSSAVAVGLLSLVIG